MTRLHGGLILSSICLSVSSIVFMFAGAISVLTLNLLLSEIFTKIGLMVLAIDLAVYLIADVIKEEK